MVFTAHSFFETSDDGTITTEFLGVPKKDVPALVVEYVELLKISETSKYCTCEWLVSSANPKLKRRGQESWDCWIHTKVGFLLGFFTWIFKERPEEPEWPGTIEASGGLIKEHLNLVGESGPEMHPIARGAIVHASECANAGGILCPGCNNCVCHG